MFEQSQIDNSAEKIVLHKTRISYRVIRKEYIIIYIMYLF